MSSQIHLCWLACALFVLVAPVQGQAPVDVERNVREVIVGPPPPVATLADLSQRSDLIVVGTLLSTSEPTVKNGAVIREQRILVEDVIADARATLSGGIVRLRVVGGAVTQGGVEYRTSYSVQPVLANERALLFLSVLERDAEGTVFAASFGNRSIFRASKAAGLAEARFAADATARHLPELRQGALTLDSFKAFLRGLR